MLRIYFIDEFNFSYGINAGAEINLDISNSYKMFLETKDHTYFNNKNRRIIV